MDFYSPHNVENNWSLELTHEPKSLFSIVVDVMPYRLSVIDCGSGDKSL